MLQSRGDAPFMHEGTELLEILQMAGTCRLEMRNDRRHVRNDVAVHPDADDHRRHRVQDLRVRRRRDVACADGGQCGNTPIEGVQISRPAVFPRGNAAQGEPAGGKPVNEKGKPIDKVHEAEGVPSVEMQPAPQAHPSCHANKFQAAEKCKERPPEDELQREEGNHVGGKEQFLRPRPLLLRRRPSEIDHAVDKKDNHRRVIERGKRRHRLGTEDDAQGNRHRLRCGNHHDQRRPHAQKPRRLVLLRYGKVETKHPGMCHISDPQTTWEHIIPEPCGRMQDIFPGREIPCKF